MINRLTFLVRFLLCYRHPLRKLPHRWRPPADPSRLRTLQPLHQRVVPGTSSRYRLGVDDADDLFCSASNVPFVVIDFVMPHWSSPLPADTTNVTLASSHSLRPAPEMKVYILCDAANTAYLSTPSSRASDHSFVLVSDAKRLSTIHLQMLESIAPSLPARPS